ncbi:unnamed protein product [Ambrosiozyma monospora]|uniref:Unnamed protein product n=1 Tax=Ambrosiozyma monospora TaxID=43982 RepID=A0ACB5UD24_AMBMO|nr:unnamed protein product [Ambrosiozyma monospora]
MSTAQILKRSLTNSSLLFSRLRYTRATFTTIPTHIHPHRQSSLLMRFSSTLTSTPPQSPSTTAAGAATAKTIDPENNPLLDFSRTKVKNQQFSDQNELPLFIAISKNAADKLNEISKKDNNPDLALRVSVESGGCHGFQYNLKLSDVNDFKPTEDDIDWFPI